MTAALAICGWALAIVTAWRVVELRRRLELVACAEHELRGPLAALTLAAARRRPLETAVVEGQLERARVALADLTAARRGRRAPAVARRVELKAIAERAAASWAGTGAEVTLDWRAGSAVVDADPGRISQALGNLLSNALEHGDGRVVVQGERVGRGVRVKVANRRGRGLAIAARAASDSGAQLALSRQGQRVIASIDLPAGEP